MEGHSEEGFALAWNPHAKNQLLSGSYDKKIIMWDIENYKSTSAIVFNASCNDGVEDVKWSNFNLSVFASAHQDEKVHLYI